MIMKRTESFKMPKQIKRTLATMSSDRKALYKEEIIKALLTPKIDWKEGKKKHDAEAE
jgi:hypothetical protein